MNRDTTLPHFVLIAVAMFSLVLCWAACAVDTAEWRVMPIREPNDVLEGLKGGEGEQAMQSIYRSPSDPNVIYGGNDNSLMTRSDDNGETWTKMKCIGLFSRACTSIVCHPTDPNTVWVEGSVRDWERNDQNWILSEGLYKSTDGGDNWTFVKQLQSNYLKGSRDHYEPAGALSHSNRGHQRRIIYDPNDPNRMYWAQIPSRQMESEDDTVAGIGYIRVDVNSLTAGADYGDSWTADVNNGDMYTYSLADNYIICTVETGAIPGIGSNITGSGMTPTSATVTRVINPAPAFVWRSENAGTTWVAQDDVNDYNEVWWIEPHPDDSDTVYLGTDTGIFKSTDKGASFATMDTGSDDVNDGVCQNIIAVKDVEGDLYLFALIENDGVWKSTDGGTTWVDIGGPITYSTDHGYISLGVHPSDPNHILIVGGDNTGWVIPAHTTDMGTNWHMANALGDPGTIVVDYNGIHENSKIRVRQDGEPIPRGTLLPNPDDVDDWITHVRGAWFKTVGDPNKWKITNEYYAGYSGLAPQQFAFHPTDTDTWWAGFQDVGYWKTTNNGESWTQMIFSQISDDDFVNWADIPAPNQPYFGTTNVGLGMAYYTADPNYIVASYGSTSAGSIIWSENGGTTWYVDPCDTGAVKKTEAYQVGFSLTDPNVMIGGDRISWENANGRISFGDITEVFVPSNPWHGGQFFHVCPNCGDFWAGKASYVYNSADDGATWSQIAKTTNGLYKNFLDVYSIAFRPNDCNVFYIADRDDGDMERFENNAWVNINEPSLDTTYFDEAWPILINPDDTQVMYISQSGPGVSKAFKTIDGGAVWTDISGNLPRFSTSSMTMNPNTYELFISTPAGTWVYPPHGYTTTGEAPLWETLVRDAQAAQAATGSGSARRVINAIRFFRRRKR